MSEINSIPTPGNIYHQRAIILHRADQSERHDRSLVKLHVSDEHGDISGKFTDERTITIFEKNFQEQFAQEREGVFIRAAEVESCDPENNEIMLYRLNASGKRIMPVSTHKEKLNAFLKTFFILNPAPE